MAIQTVVIGGGQAGHSVGYHLAKRGLPFVILDANERIGDAWRKRWDSLRLFTPARFDGLDAMAFPAPAYMFPTKDDMADYLEAYAARFRLPVRTRVRVDCLTRQGDRFLATGEPGLYFVGFGLLYSASSSMVHGVGRHAERVVKHLAARTLDERAAAKYRSAPVARGSCRARRRARLAHPPIQER